jgi:hypothetical protein
MNVPHEHGQSSKERLEYVARASKPFHRELWGPNSLIAVGLLLLLLTLVGVGIVGGILSSDVVKAHAQQIFDSMRR